MGTLRLRPDELAWQELDGHVVLLDLRAGIYLEVNGSGSVLFPLLVEGVEDTGPLMDALVEQFQVDRQTASTDVEAFVALLRQKDLLAP